MHQTKYIFYFVSTKVPVYVKRLEKFSDIQGADGRLSHMARPRYISKQNKKKCDKLSYLCHKKRFECKMYSKKFLLIATGMKSNSSQYLTARYHQRISHLEAFAFFKRVKL